MPTGHADVVDPAGRAPAPREPVQRGVGGPQQRIVQHDRADQPQHDPVGAAELQRLQQRPGGQRQRGEVREQVQRRCAVAGLMRGT